MKADTENIKSIANNLVDMGMIKKIEFSQNRVDRTNIITISLDDAFDTKFIIISEPDSNLDVNVTFNKEVKQVVRVSVFDN